MHIDGLALAEGSSIVNLTVSSDTSFPSSATTAELFYKTGSNEGLYVYDGAAWVLVHTGTSSSSSWTTLSDKPTTLSGFGLSSEVSTLIATGAGIDLIRYLSQPGVLNVFAGKARWYPPQSVNVLWLEASVDTAPTGSDVLVLLKKNGITVANSTITINVSQNKSARVALTGVTGTSSDYFTVDVTQIGSLTAGSDLVVALAYEYQLGE